jgi:HlyD family secretion protein
MSAKSQHNNILLAIAGFVTVVIIVAIIGFLVLDRDPEIIQGQVEVTEYRVSSKVPGRILELRVKEGDYVKVGDTLAILDAPEVRAKMEQARSAESAAAALELKAQNGARKEQIQGAYSVLQQAKAGYEIAEKSYQRIQRLYDEGVMSAQKRDEVYANYKAMEAQMKAAQSQYDMAVNGARMEDKMAAAAQVGRARGIEIGRQQDAVLPECHIHTHVKRPLDFPAQVGIGITDDAQRRCGGTIHADHTVGLNKL